MKKRIHNILPAWNPFRILLSQFSSTGEKARFTSVVSGRIKQAKDQLADLSLSRMRIYGVVDRTSYAVQSRVVRTCLSRTIDIAPVV
jgi:hypothetical protein